MSLGARVYLNFSLFLLLGTSSGPVSTTGKDFHNSILQFNMNEWALLLQSW